VAALLSSFVVFALLAFVVLTMVDPDRDGDDVSGFATIAVWFAYLVHADTVVTAAYLTTGRLSFLPHDAFLIIGLAILALGFVLFFRATRVLVGGGEFDGPVSHRLVTSGPYALCRHPQDLGWALMLLGVAVAGRSPIALVLVAIFAWFSAKLARADEIAMGRRFGPLHAAYKAMVPAIPTREHLRSMRRRATPIA
jgi:protein-S-isoprenylcysteine O-methyltransferase Ste14